MVTVVAEAHFEFTTAISTVPGFGDLMRLKSKWLQITNNFQYIDITALYTLIPIYNGNYRMLKRYLQYEIDDNLVDFDAAYAKGVQK